MPISNVHDKFIKQILSDIVLAIDFIKEFLPPTLVKSIDFSTLTRVDSSYLNRNLQEAFSDLIWQVKLHRDENLQISLLLEHKSSPDPHVMFQLLEYLACGYRKQIREKKKPALIVPIIYYHGKRKWKLKPLDHHFRHYPDFMHQYLPVFTPEFINLQDLAPQQVMALQNGLLSSAMMLQKHSFDPEALSIHISTILKNLNPYLESNALDVIFVYMIKGTRLTEKQYKEIIKNLPEQMSTRAMTLMDDVIHNNKDQWLAEGIAKGIAQSTKSTILNAFDNGIKISVIRAITGETEEKIYTILRDNKRNI